MNLEKILEWSKNNKSEFIGYTGSILYISAFFLVSQGFIDGKGAIFNLMNLAGAIVYLIYCKIKKALPIFILEIFWGGIAVLALIKLVLNTLN